MADGITYESLKREYDNFSFPLFKFTIKGKTFSANKEGFLIDWAELELSSGYEASIAEFRIINAYDMAAGEFLSKKLSAYVELGAAISIKAGYLVSLHDVFMGVVVGMDYGYEEGGFPYVHVTAMDVKGIMMANQYSLQLHSRSCGEAVREILEKPAYARIVNNLRVTDTPDKSSGAEKESADTVEMVAESDYEFVVKAAKRFNYEFFTDFDAVYFRKAKCKTDTLMTLGVNRGIITFNVGYSITGLVDQIEIRSIDSGTGKLITSSGRRTGRLSQGSKAGALLNKSKKVYLDPTVTSQEQARARIDFLIEDMSYRFGELQCECVGIPQLMPGRFLGLEGMGEVVSNRFYVTKTVHTIGEQGYRTRVRGIAKEIGDQSL